MRVIFIEIHLCLKPLLLFKIGTFMCENLYYFLKWTTTLKGQNKYC